MDELWQKQIEEEMGYQIYEMEYEMQKEMEKDLLGERGNTHGDFKMNSITVQHLKATMREGDYYELPDYMKEALDMIQHKIGRILHGDPFVKDHWDDIIGYTSLVVKELEKDELTVYIDQKKYRLMDGDKIEL